jgi:hypothetical protein
MGYGYEAEDDTEDHRRPCADGDRASLREVSGVASAGGIVGNVVSWGSDVRRVRIIGLRGHIGAGEDSNRSLLSTF